MLQFIYNHSPIVVQNIMVSVQGKLFENQRYTKHYYNELVKLRCCKYPFELQNERIKIFYKLKNEFYQRNKLE